MEILSKSSKQTYELGIELSKRLKEGDVVSVYGELGAGKTRIIQGICKGFDVKERVTSPSFTLINEYSGKYKVFHFDFYRINSVPEAVDIGCIEYFYSDGVCLIEWPEKIEEIIPENAVRITLEYHNERKNWRKVQIHVNRSF